MIDQVLPGGARCARHPEQAAAQVCTRCGDFLCGPCLRKRGARAYCRDCAPELPVLSSPGARVAAHLLDAGVLVIAPFMLTPLAAQVHQSLVAPVAIAAFVGLPVAQLVTIARRGQSLGKLALGIRVVREDGSQASLLRIVFLRNIVPWIFSAFPLFGLIDAAMLFGDKRRTLHDQIAGTVVIDARSQRPSRFRSVLSSLEGRFHPGSRR